jgi:hypothetical protein
VIEEQSNESNSKDLLLRQSAIQRMRNLVNDNESQGSFRPEVMSSDSEVNWSLQGGYRRPSQLIVNRGAR